MSDTDRTLPLDLKPEDHEGRMRVVRRLCQWEFDDPSWAEMVVGAYLYPRYYSGYLDREGADR